MVIMTGYKTSKGFFLNKEEAEKKKNRTKHYDLRYDDFQRYETVKEVKVLTDGTSFFELNEIVVNF